MGVMPTQTEFLLSVKWDFPVPSFNQLLPGKLSASHTIKPLLELTFMVLAINITLLDQVLSR